MGLIGSLMVKLGADAAPLKSGLKQGEEAVKQFGKQTEQVGKKTKSSFDSSISSVQSFAGEVAKIGATLTAVTTIPIVLAGKAGNAFNSMMEQANVSFEVLLGDANKAKAMLADLTTFANSTPFEMVGLANASKVLLAFGVDANRIMPAIKMLGDISLGNAQRFDSLSLAYAQVQSTGRLMGQDLLQMVNVGFNPLQIISEKTGMSMADLKKKMEEGAISSDMVTLAMKEATGEGGRFYNAMDKISKTQEGQLSTLRDAWNSALGTAVKPISEWLTGEGLPKMTAMVTTLKDAFIRLEPAITKTLDKVGDMIDAFAKMTPAQQDAVLNSVLLVGALAPIITGFALATTGVLGFIAALNGVSGAGAGAALGGISGMLPGLAAVAGVGLATSMEGKKAWESQFGQSISKSTQGASLGVGMSIPSIVDVTNSSQRAADAAGRNATYPVGTANIAASAGVSNKIVAAANAMQAKLTAAADMAKAKKSASDYASEWQKLINELNKTDPATGKVDKLKQAVDALKDSFKSQMSAFANFTGLFDIFERKLSSPLSLLRRLNAQVKAMEQWQSALASLQGRGVNSMLLDEIRQMGPGAVDDVMALSRMTNEQLAQYEQLYGRKQGIAATAATGFTINITGNQFLGAGSMDEVAEMFVAELKRRGVKIN